MKKLKHFYTYNPPPHLEVPVQAVVDVSGEQRCVPELPPALRAVQIGPVVFVHVSEQQNRFHSALFTNYKVITTILFEIVSLFTININAIKLI